MTTARKADAPAIRSHLDALAGEQWLGAARSWWPKFLFRTDPIESAAAILQCGELRSRSLATKEGALAYDAASQSVIAGTEDKWKEHVRMYFRPRSPTQFSTEGFRPADAYQYGSKCPVPIVFLLDAYDVLTRTDTVFSDGNLGKRGARIGGDAKFLAAIPWKKVYHDSWFESGERDTIIYSRHAEAAVPDRLALADCLRLVGCRTQAEYETLWSLLDPSTRAMWGSKIVVSTRFNLHFGDWLFVEQATLSADRVQFQISPSCTRRGPLVQRVEILRGNIPLGSYDAAGDVPATLRIGLGSIGRQPAYGVRMTLDGRLAYQGTYDEAKLVPF